MPIFGSKIRRYKPDSFKDALKILNIYLEQTFIINLVLFLILKMS